MNQVHTPPDNVILSGVVGSTAYGLATADSDVDLLGVFASPTEAFHGLTPPTETYVFNGPDQTYHEARKYLRLCLKMNPTVTELMWLPERHYTTVTRLGRKLIGIRSAFLSRKLVRDAYLGYATSQFRKLVTDGQFKSTYRARAEKHARHVYRLLIQGFHLYTAGELQIEVKDPQQVFDFAKQAAEDPTHAQSVITHYEEAFNAFVSPLPSTPDRERVEDWLLDVRRYYWPH